MGQMHIHSFDREKIKAFYEELVGARRSTIEDSRSEFERVLRLWELRVGFTEKLILLDAGTFALTLSFLGALGSHSAARHASPFLLPILYIAWGFLLISIVCGGLHNIFRMLSAEHLMVVIASVGKQYRYEEDAHRFQRMMGLMKGTIKTDDGEEIDIDAFIDSLSAAGAGESQKQSTAAEQQAKKFRTRLTSVTRCVVSLEATAVLGTVIALLLLAIVAGQSAWILLQK